jgi:3D-(3,5/4)-trihydroxycyclohexane-1,2-dione acylhydrolase (decyclizing)
MDQTTHRMTMAQALVRYLCSQFTLIDGVKVPLFAGVFGIFGHGNVTCLSEALEAVQDQLPTWRGQNEQSMALAAIGFAKAKRRRQIMIATSSIGPGALNMVTAAGTAHANTPVPTFAQVVHQVNLAAGEPCSR